MNVAATLSFLTALFKAIPVLRKSWDDLVAAYIKLEKAKIDKEILEGIRKAIEEHNQISLEESIGSTMAGKPTNYPGAVIVDKLPGVEK